jgi:release factor glutamine methyltransferase
MKSASFLDYCNLGERYLDRLGVEGAKVSSRRLLGHVLGVSETDLLLSKASSISSTKRGEYFKLLRRRGERFPLQYLLGEVSFRNICLEVDENVLIPRPETELVVDIIHEHFKEDGSFKLIDVGTGSGNIALSVADEFRKAEIDAIDISSAALQVAKRNARKLGLNERVNFYEGDLFEGCRSDQTWDVIVSNPPYVAFEEEKDLEGELSFEPRMALFAENKGLQIIEKLIQDSYDYLKEKGLLILEIGMTQALYIQRVAEGKGRFTFNVRQDYSGRDRFVILRKK